MTGPFIVEPLADRHDRKSFESGADPLDRYFRERVTQDIRRHVTHCFVALDPAGIVAGYYTFAASGLSVGEIPEDEARRLPRYPFLPAGLIGRLAVDHRFRRQGLGSALIVDAIERSLRADPAIFALIVDAKDDTARDFYLHHGFRPFASQPMSLFLPIADTARLLDGLNAGKR